MVKTVLPVLFTHITKNKKTPKNLDGAHFQPDLAKIRLKISIVVV